MWCTTQHPLFTPHGGKIKLVLVSDADDWKVTVSDAGIGIAPELLPQVFDMFMQGEQRIDRQMGGLGLAIIATRYRRWWAVSCASAGDFSFC